MSDSKADREALEAALVEAVYEDREPGPELARALAEDPGLQALREDVLALRELAGASLAAEAGSEALVPPRNALARAIQVFEADAEVPGTWWERMRTWFLVPALSLAALAFLLPGQPAHLEWDDQALEAPLVELARGIDELDGGLEAPRQVAGSRPLELASLIEEPDHWRRDLALVEWLQGPGQAALEEADPEGENWESFQEEGEGWPWPEPAPEWEAEDPQDLGADLEQDLDGLLQELRRL